MPITKPKHIQIYLLDSNLYCYHCAQKFNLFSLLPISIEMTIVIFKQFTKEHKRCKQTELGKDLERRHEQEWAISRKNLNEL